MTPNPGSPPPDLNALGSGARPRPDQLARLPGPSPGPHQEPPQEPRSPAPGAPRGAPRAPPRHDARHARPPGRRASAASHSRMMCATTKRLRRCRRCLPTTTKPERQDRRMEASLPMCTARNGLVTRTTRSSGVSGHRTPTRETSSPCRPNMGHGSAPPSPASARCDTPQRLSLDRCAESSGS